MRRFQYVEPSSYKDVPITITVSAYWLTLTYYPLWLNKMRKKFGEEYVINNCCLEDAISDWMMVNWAVEL